MSRREIFCQSASGKHNQETTVVNQHICSWFSLHIFELCIVAECCVTGLHYVLIFQLCRKFKPKCSWLQRKMEGRSHSKCITWNGLWLKWWFYHVCQIEVLKWSLKCCQLLEQVEATGLVKDDSKLIELLLPVENTICRLATVCVNLETYILWWKHMWWKK